MPLRMVQSCKTRWLSVEVSVRRILAQFDTLKTHFNLARGADKCFTAERLYELYSDEKLKSYLIFILPHLERVQRANKLFQSKPDECDVSRMLDSLCQLIEQTANTITRQRRDFDALTSTVGDYVTPDADLGYRFEEHMRMLKTRKLCTDDDEKLIREKCRKFLIALVSSLRARLPENIVVLRNMSQISIKKALMVIKPDLTQLMEALQYDADKITSVNMQWKDLTLVRWKEKDLTAAIG